MVRGPVRRKAYQAATAVEATALAYKDGVAIELELDWDQIVADFRLAIAGKLKGKKKLPGRLLIDPSYIAPKK
jgi:hypothetical protein